MYSDYSYKYWEKYCQACNRQSLNSHAIWVAFDDYNNGTVESPYYGHLWDPTKLSLL